MISWILFGARVEWRGRGKPKVPSSLCPPQMCDRIRAFRVRDATYSLSYGTAFRAGSTSQLCINANIPVLSTGINTVTDTRGANQVRHNNHQNTTVSAVNASTSRDCCIAVKRNGNMGTKGTKSLRQVGWSGYPAIRCHPVCTVTCSCCWLLAQAALTQTAGGATETHDIRQSIPTKYASSPLSPVKSSSQDFKVTQFQSLNTTEPSVLSNVTKLPFCYEWWLSG